MTRAQIWGLVVLFFGTAGCPRPPVCPTLATRCNGLVVEVCDSAGQWASVQDCSRLWESSGGEWVCGESREDGEEVNTCLPAPETP